MSGYGEESEEEIVARILAFEQQKFTECTERLEKHTGGARRLSIAIKPVLSRQRGVNNWGKVEDYDLQSEQKMPKFYTSNIICYACRNGLPLTEQAAYDKSITGYFTVIFPLVTAWKRGAVELGENPFDDPYNKFDAALELLFSQVSAFMHRNR